MQINMIPTPKMTAYKWCRLMNPREGDDFGAVCPIIYHGEPTDPRSIVTVMLHRLPRTRNIFDVAILNNKKERIKNPWLCPDTTVSEVCRVLGINIHSTYNSEFLDNLAEQGYPYPPNKSQPSRNITKDFF